MEKKRLRLKRIELIGFKSFADRTLIAFGEGVTGVVGPNGCGKSNVADAFRWVMGEQSARSLRGEKMQDVIFAGTKKRKRAPYAQVSLLLANEGEELSLPYREVEITRRLYATGESVYQLNGNKIRLREIQRLFWDSGIGKEAFAIFEQGKMEEIIHRPPEERRLILEQAAGIYGYRQEWREADRKLKQTEANLLRLRDIYKEVEGQLRRLKRQATEAKKYHAAKEELELLHQRLLLLRWKKVERKEQLARAEEEKARLKLEKIDEELLQLQGRIGEAEAQIEQEMKEWEEVKELSLHLRSADEISRLERANRARRLEEGTQREEKLRDEERLLVELLRGLEEERLSLGQEVKELRVRSQEATKERDGRLEETSALQRGLDQLRKAREGKRGEHRHSLEKLHQIATSFKEERVREEAAAFEEKRLEMEEEILSKRLQRVQIEEKELQGAHENLSAKVAEGRRRVAEEENIEAAAEQLYKEARATEEGLRHGLTEAVSRQETLQQMEADGIGYTEATGRLLQESRKKGSPFQGQLTLLTEKVVAKKGKEQQMAAALQPYAQTLWLEKGELLPQLLQFALEEGLKGFSLSSAALLSGKGGEEPSWGEMPEPFYSLFAEVKEVDEKKLLAPKKGRERYVTKGGMSRDAFGVLVVGGGGESLPLFRRAALRETERRVRALQKELQGAERASQEKEKEREKARARVEKVRVGLAEAEHEGYAIQMKLDQKERECKSLAKEWEGSQEKRREASLRRGEIGERLLRYAEEQKGAEERLKELQGALERIEGEEEGAVVAFQESTQALTGAERRLAEERTLLHRVEERLVFSERELTTGKKRLQEIAVEAKRCKAVMKEVEQELKGFEKEERGSQSKHRQIEERKGKLERRLERLQKGREDLRSKEQQVKAGGEEVKSRLQRSLWQLEEVERKKEHVRKEAQERFEAAIEELLERGGDVKGSIEEVERAIKEKNRALDHANQVNLGAIEECAACEERHQTLRTQLEDLEGARKGLLNLVAELDEESRQRFLQTYQLVRENFQKLFRTLFHGGEADLTFVGSKDVLEAGLEIIARPPGKKMRSIRLLSGGEKCLTAVALLFALFEAKPAPFCILDEMDAPLDDANVRRFLRVLAPFMEETQFVIITHNKLTMEVADVLYGITMEEEGVSKKMTMQLRRPEPMVSQPV